MGVLVYVLGRTGTGKSYSMRNFPKDKLAVVNVEGKILPFKGSGAIETTNTDDSDKILRSLEIYSKDYKSIVVDDFQYIMSNEFMRRAAERGYDKFTEIAAHAWGIADKVRELPSDVIVYVMCHTDVDAEGTERLKTIGKLLDEKIYLEGMSTIVLKTLVSDGKYSFATQNNGKDTVKSPADMFPSYAIDNDLYYVDQKIREYYGLGAVMSPEELAKADADATHDDVQKPEKKKRGNRGKEKKEEPAEASQKEKEEIANAGIPDDGREEVPFEEIEMPTRKEREQPSEEPEGTSEASEETPKRRRRRRA